MPRVKASEASQLRGGEECGGDDVIGEESARDAFEEIDFGREFQDYLDPGYKTQEIEYKEDAPTFRTVSDASSVFSGSS